MNNRGKQTEKTEKLWTRGWTKSLYLIHSTHAAFKLACIWGEIGSLHRKDYVFAVRAGAKVGTVLVF